MITQCSLPSPVMSPKRRSVHRFTMVEMLFASAATVLLLATVATVLLFPYRAWGESVANFYLDHRIRIVRERILRGIDGGYGLRAASLGSIQIQPGETTQVEWVNFDVDDNDIPTPDNPNDDVTCRVVVTPGLGLAARTLPGSGTPKSMLGHNVTVERFDVTQKNRTLSIVLALSTQWGGKTYTREQNFDVYIRND